MNEKYEFRQMRQKDIIQVAALEQEHFPDPWSTKSLTDLLVQKCCFGYVLAQDTAILAYAITQEVIDEGELLRIAVWKRHLRQGFGSRLLQALLLKAAAVQTWNLEVRESNLAARALYKQAGFQTIGTRRGYYYNPTEDALLMQYKRR